MADIVKIIIKDKFVNKVVSLKVKEETPLNRVLEILEKRYEHTQKPTVDNAIITLRGEELPWDMTLGDLVSQKNYTENDRVEIQEKPKVTKPAVEKKEMDFVKMMSKGGNEFSKAIIEILIKGQVINRELAQSALQTATLEKRSVVATLVEGAYLKEKDILTTVSRSLEIPSVDLENVTIENDVLSLISKNVAEHYCILPIRKEGKKLSVAVTNPFDTEKLSEIRMVTGTELEPLFSTELAIRAKMKLLYQRKPEPVKPPAEAAKPTPEPAPAPSRQAMKSSAEKERSTPPTAVAPMHEDSPKPVKKPLIIKDGKKLDYAPDDECAARTLSDDRQGDFNSREEADEEIERLKAGERRSRKSQSRPSEILDSVPLKDNLFDLPLAEETPGIDISSLDLSGFPTGDGVETALENAENIVEGIPILTGSQAEIPDAVAIDLSEAAAASLDLPEEEADEKENALDYDSLKTSPFGVQADSFKKSAISLPESPLSQDEEFFKMTPEELELERSIHEEALPQAVSAVKAQEPAFPPLEEALQIPEALAPLSLGDALLMPEALPEAPTDLRETQKVIHISSEADLLGGEAIAALFEEDKDSLPTEGKKEGEKISTLPAGVPAPAETKRGKPALAEPKIAGKPPLVEAPVVEKAPAKAEAPAPIVEKAPTKAEAPAPIVEKAPAKAEAPAPIVEKAPAKAEAPAPIVEKSPAKAEAPAPVIEEAPAKVEAPAPVVEKVTVVETTLSGKLETQPTVGPSLVAVSAAVTTVSRAPEMVTPAPAPAPVAIPTVEKKEIVEKPKTPILEKIVREITVRYYKKMYPSRTYPLVVLFSKKKLDQILAEKAPEIRETHGKALQVEAQKPEVKIIPYFPGCLTVPPEVTVDLTPEKTQTRLWVTPLTEGKIQDAQVQIWYQNKCVQTIHAKVKIVKQKPAKFFAFLSFLLPILAFAYEAVGSPLLFEYPLLDYFAPYWDLAVSEAGGLMNLSLLLGACCLVLSMVWYAVGKAKKARPVVKMLDFA